MLNSHGWDGQIVEAVSTAVRLACSGTPTVLLVEGSAGTGKTTLLEDVAGEADGFRQLAVDGVEASSAPYDALVHAGLLTARPSGETATTFAVAQLLRARLDELASAPLLLRVDDLHWVDPESVEVLTWLLRRLAGDRIMTVVGTRPLPPDQHGSWQRWVRASANVRRLTLSGLSEDVAVELARGRRPSISREAARLLWRHTDGNPLYLTALLDEHDPAELPRLRVLPAPSVFEQLTAERLARLDVESVDLVRAAAVLGAGWAPLPVLAVVSGVSDVDSAAQQGDDAGLLQVRDLQGGAAARPSHALVRAAVYHATPLPQRRAMHLRAARIVSDPTAALEHRVQAVSAWDDQLAAELEKHAAQLHDERSHRVAAQFLEWSGAATSDPALRMRRQLESCYEALLDGQQVIIPAALPSPGGADRVALLRGVEAVLSGRPDDAVRILGPIAWSDPPADDPLLQFRANTFLAWARMLAGGATDAVLGDLAKAEAAGVSDSALGFYNFYTRGIVSARSSSPEELAEQVAFLPEAVADVPADQRYLLAWRGEMRLFMGVVPEAATDIREAIKHVEARGGSDFHDDGPYGAMGVAHWLHGEWDLAKVAFNLVRDFTDRPLPIVLTYLPLHPLGVGEFAAADELLEQAIGMFERMPWQEAVQQLLIPRVVRAHATGDQTEQAMLLDDMRRRWPRAFVDTGLVSSFWVLHAGLAAIWAEDKEYAERMIRRLDRPGLARWCPAALGWLHGLAAERRGELQTALDHLRDSTAADARDVPFYLAHMHNDHGRVAAALGRPDEAAREFERAQELYRKLGAVPYLQTEPLACTASKAGGPLRDGFGLTEREQDIAALIAAGMSYVQIARELFITRSTVNYHLGNIYAKVGVRSRYQLRDVMRAATGP